MSEQKKTAIVIAATVLVTVAGISHTQLKQYDPLTREEAIATVIRQHPNFSPYATIDSEQLDIQTKATPSGWHVAFVKKAKNAATVEQAACYYASMGGTVSSSGIYAGEESEFSFDMCAGGGDLEPQVLGASTVATTFVPPPPKPQPATCTCPAVTDVCSRWKTCELTPNGQCVVKQTPELTACLANPGYAQM